MKKLISSLAIATIMFFGSCKKNNEVIPGSTSAISYSSLGDFFESRTSPLENFTISAQTGGSFTGAYGTIINFPPNAFADQNGNIVSGDVTIHFKEVFSKTEMIYSNVLPVSYNNALNSGGQYYIAASKNGQALHLPEGITYQAVMPSQAEDPNMMLFLGETMNDPDAFVAVDWQPINQWDTLSTEDQNFTFNSADDTYTLNLDSMGWSNIDAFTNFTGYFDITITLTGASGLDNSNTMAYAIFDDANAVWPMADGSFGNITNNIITETHLGDVAMHIVVISVVNGQLYSGILAVIPAPNTPLTIAMSPTTAADLDILINSCP
jgi:hypothetical protein